MDKTTPIVVRFARGGPHENVKLTKEETYYVSVDNGPREIFQSPWDEEELDDIIRVLRNNETDERPDIKRLEEIGIQLADAAAKVTQLVAKLMGAVPGRRCVYWQLDYPELARIPWELMTYPVSPHHHILLDPNISFVRTVPLFQTAPPCEWPTGLKKTLRLLFVWGETAGKDVPNKDHEDVLNEICNANGIELTAREIKTIADLQSLVQDTTFDFVHILAHGARTKHGQWGLGLADEAVKGAQIARTLVNADGAPALVTLAACDSGGIEDNQFGSVAYELHAEGIPMVLASQFRLRKSASNLSVVKVYKDLLSGEHPLNALTDLRRQLSPTDNEAWANDVLYLNYAPDTMDRGALVGKQQAILRRARVLDRQYKDSTLPEEGRSAAIATLEAQITKLNKLVQLNFDLSETYGLLGSMTRRIAYLRKLPPDMFDLEKARDYYRKGVKPQSGAYYPGINAIHLSLLIGDHEEAKRLSNIVRFLLDDAMDGGSISYWVYASAGELEVYAGRAQEARNHYRKFVEEEKAVVSDKARRRDEIGAAFRQLQQFLAHPSVFEVSTNAPVVEAAKVSLTYLMNELERL